MVDPEDISKMTMDFDEFCEAIVAVAFMRPKKKKSDPFTKQLACLCEDMLTLGSKKFMS